MKLSSSQSFGLLFAFGLVHQFEVQIVLAALTTAQSVHSKLIDKCCQIGKEQAIENPKFNCKLSAREALVNSGNHGGGNSQHQRKDLLALSAESLLARDSNFADQCEMVLESCCMAHHRTKNCDSGKQFAKSGAACMDVELSKEATIATESFNDCCMSCSLGILAARNPTQNETNQSVRQQNGLLARCKLISPLASSLSGQLYEQTYIECCQENLPRQSGALIEPGTPIDCGSQSSPCSQRCLSAGHLDPITKQRIEQDRCDCFGGYKLASDGVNCVDIDECKLGTHTCDKESAICDNIKGSFRCLARAAAAAAAATNNPHQGHHMSSSSSSSSRSTLFNNLKDESTNSASSSFASPDADDNLNIQPETFVSLRLCPIGMRWNLDENKCQSIAADSSTSHHHHHHHQHQRNGPLFVPSSSSSSGFHYLRT